MQRTPEHLGSFLPKDIERWGKVIRDRGWRTWRDEAGAAPRYQMPLAA